MNASSTRSVSVCRLATALLASATMGMILCGSASQVSAQDGAFSGSHLFGTAFDMQRSLYFWMNATDGESYGGANQHVRFGGTKYFLFDDGALLLTGQGLYTDPGRRGTSAGVVRRWLVNSYVFGDAVLGAGVHWDMTESAHDNYYHQVVGTAELLAENWAVRITGYGPVGDRSNTLAVTGATGVYGLPFFQANSLLIGGTREVLEEVALGGLEAELAVSLRNLCTVALRREIEEDIAEVFLGYYNLQGTLGRQGHGIKGGLRGYLLPSLAASVTVSNDRLFGNSVYGGFTWFFGGSGGNSPSSIQDKLTIPVVRNHQVALTRLVTDLPTDPVQLTSGGQSITFMHVDGSGIAGDGTFERPHGSLTGAKTDPNKANRDVVYVQSGSTFIGQDYVVAPNQRMLGEGSGNVHRVNTDEAGLIQLPQVGGLDLARPSIQNVTGTAFTAADGSEISNFNVVAAGTATAIRLNNLAGDVNVNRMLVSGGETGIDILGGSGTFTFTGVGIADSTTAGMVVDGGSSTVNFGGPNLPLAGQFGPSALTQSGGGTALLVQGGHNGTLIQTPGSPISADSGNGLQFDNADGTYNFSGPIMLAGGDAGIDILSGSNGVFTFVNPTIANPSTGPGVNIVGGTAQTTFQGLTLTTNGTVGLNADGTSLDLSVSDGTITSSGDDAIVLDGLNNFSLNNTTVVNEATFDTINTTNSNLSGAGNTAPTFNCANGGGNSGSISFNGGADTCP